MNEFFGSNKQSATPTRAHALGRLAATASLALTARPALAAAPAGAPSAGQLSADDAFAHLVAGNERYRRDQAINCNKNYDRRAEVAAAQAPLAIVLGCADSRVPPEVIFDQRLGDLFVVRVAGNVADDVAIGSIEYAVEHFHTPLVLVLGHARCGAVIATLDALRSDTAVPGFVGRIVEAISPAAARALHGGGDPLPAAIRYNVSDVVAQLRTRSTVLHDAEASGNLRLRGATYDLGDGRVTPVESSP